MENPFTALNDKERTDERYLDRVEFFLSLKNKEAGVRSVARDETRDLLKSKNVATAKLKARLGGRMQKAPNIEKNYSGSAQAVAKRRNNVDTAEIKKPSAKATAVTTKTPDVASKNKDRVKQLLKKKS